MLDKPTTQVVDVHGFFSVNQAADAAMSSDSISAVEARFLAIISGLTPGSASRISAVGDLPAAARRGPFRRLAALSS